ncbi:MAG: hypothetical protein L0Z55_08685 [Planctomycetes bacterium]|nr:hypothetical protein [Planctomycetota bacterium]
MQFRVAGTGWEERWHARGAANGGTWELHRAGGTEAPAALLQVTVAPIEEGIVRFTLAGATYTLAPLPGNRPGAPFRFLIDGDYFELTVENEMDLLEAKLGSERGGPRETPILSVMPGVIRKVLAAPGELVTANQPLLILEAMKMENEVRSPIAGKLDRLCVREGGTVATGELLAVIVSS